MDAYRQFAVHDKTLYAYGFKHFWRASVRSFFPGRKIRFIGGAEQKALVKVADKALVLVWGSTQLTSDAAQRIICDKDLRVLRLEDGFIRSVGLGAEFSRPLSWIADSRTPYFDATKPSDLEYYLATHQFSDQERQQGQQLIDQIVSSNISKYNVGGAPGALFADSDTTPKRIILIAGQVESDASIKLGALQLRTNLALVQAVRAANPNAHLVYKPHPDVVAKARQAGNDEHQAFEIADQVITDTAIELLYPHIDELHCNTSLAGFEALLRGVEVHCWGAPFYAGWGVTRDHWQNLQNSQNSDAHALQQRRQARRTIAELTYATLQAYPLYVLGSATATLQALSAQKQRAVTPMRVLEAEFKRVVRRVMNKLRKPD